MKNIIVWIIIYVFVFIFIYSILLSILNQIGEVNKVIQPSLKNQQKILTELKYLINANNRLSIIQLEKKQSDDMIYNKTIKAWNRLTSQIHKTIEETKAFDILLTLKAFNNRYNPRTVEKMKFAVVMYATDDVYACSALINANRLRKFKLSSYIDIIVMIPKPLEIKNVYLQKMNKLNIIIQRVDLLDAPKTDKMSYHYRYAMTKLRIFQLHYDRIIYFDCDSLLMRSLEHLFYLPPGDLYAPRAYWLEEYPLNSQLLVVEPSANLFRKKILKYYNVENMKINREGTFFDMDLLQESFNSAAFLPFYYCTLDSSFLNDIHLKVKTDLTQKFLQDNAILFHFSARKPWTATLKQERDQFKDANEFFFDIGESYRHEKEMYCKN